MALITINKYHKLHTIIWHSELVFITYNLLSSSNLKHTLQWLTKWWDTSDSRHLL